MDYEALDFYEIDSLLTDEERMVRDMVRDWVDEEVCLLYTSDAADE